MNETFTAGGVSGLKIHEGGRFAYYTTDTGQSYLLDPGQIVNVSSPLMIQGGNLTVSKGELHWAIINNEFVVEPEQEYGYITTNGVEYKFKLAISDPGSEYAVWARCCTITNTADFAQGATFSPALIAYFHYTPKE